MPKHLTFIIGARPQFIKLAPLYSTLKKLNKYTLSIIHTGQHFDHKMSQVFFEELNIPKPDYNLNIHSGNHGQQTGRMLIKIEKILLEINPDIIIVFGDTNSTLAGTLAAAKLNIPIAHIEAGLRSYDRNMPEELNRIITDQLSKYLFVPTITGLNNLKKEGISKNVYLTGDIMYDSLLHFQKISSQKSTIISDLKLSPKSYCLATIHRPSNTDNTPLLKTIFQAFIKSNVKIILPLHPRTKKALNKTGLLSEIKKSQIRVIPPCGYLDIISLMQNSRKIITDSGGIQKEAYLSKIPCLTVRDTTEWPETLTGNWNILVLKNSHEIDQKHLIKLISSEPSLGKWIKSFGDGQSVTKILSALKNI